MLPQVLWHGRRCCKPSPSQHSCSAARTSPAVLTSVTCELTSRRHLGTYLPLQTPQQLVISITFPNLLLSGSPALSYTTSHSPHGRTAAADLLGPEEQLVSEGSPTPLPRTCGFLLPPAGEHTGTEGDEDRFG